MNNGESFKYKARSPEEIVKTLPDDVVVKAAASIIGKRGGRPKVATFCPKCKKIFSTVVEFRKHKHPA